jgi:hypothetical protein
MSEVKIYKLQYMEKGEEKELDIPVGFICQAAYDKFDLIFKPIIENFNDKWRIINDNKIKIESLGIEKPEGFEDEINRLSIESLEISKPLLKFKTKDFFDNRIKLILFILEEQKEAIKLDKKFLNEEFWKRYVDIGEVGLFLNNIINKDNSGDIKKKIM